MRVGPHGLLQTLADGIKLLSKENITPLEADRFVFHLAPLLCFAATFVALAFIPFSPGIQAVNFNVGLVFVLGIGSVGVLGSRRRLVEQQQVVAARGDARRRAIISYELSATIALLSMLVFAGRWTSAGSSPPRPSWWVWRAPVGFVAFVIYASPPPPSATAPLRPRGGSELTAGFHQSTPRSASRCSSSPSS
jgi:NADH-quinone oxidoreductase subunit H